MCTCLCILSPKSHIYEGRWLIQFKDLVEQLSLHTIILATNISFGALPIGIIVLHMHMLCYSIPLEQCGNGDSLNFEYTCSISVLCPVSVHL